MAVCSKVRLKPRAEGWHFHETKLFILHENRDVCTGPLGRSKSRALHGEVIHKFPFGPRMSLPPRVSYPLPPNVTARIAPPPVIAPPVLPPPPVLTLPPAPGPPPPKPKSSIASAALAAAAATRRVGKVTVRTMPGKRAVETPKEEPPAEDPRAEQASEAPAPAMTEVPVENGINSTGERKRRRRWDLSDPAAAAGAAPSDPVPLPPPMMGAAPPPAADLVSQMMQSIKKPNEYEEQLRAQKEIQFLEARIRSMKVRVLHPPRYIRCC